MPKLKDTDYLAISTRIRALENHLLTRERMERMLEARSNDEAVKVLSECGYGDMSTFTLAGLEEKLAQARDHLYEDLASFMPNPGLLDVFRMKYDYHNAKVLIKAEARNVEAGRLLVGGGRYTPSALQDAYRKEDLGAFSEHFRQAVAQARDALATSGDPQRVDFILDSAYFAEMQAMAQQAESPFLEGYVKLLIDVANLRAVVRAHRMSRGADLLSQVLVPGGTVSPQALATADDASLAALFGGTPLAEAAALGASLSAPGSGHLTAFERLCDNAVIGYLARSRRIPFGEHVPIGYLYAKEAELTAIRIIMTGRLAGLSAETIRERLRESYV